MQMLGVLFCFMGEIVGMLIPLTARVLAFSAGFARLHAPAAPEPY